MQKGFLMKKLSSSFLYFCLFFLSLSFGNLKAESHDKKSFGKYEKLAEQGDAEAQFNLGWMYSKGRGVLKNISKSFYWYEKSAEQGYTDAQNNLGFMYLQVQGDPKNHEKAFEWYKKAAKQGHADAQYNVGMMYSVGQGVLKNVDKAFEWYKKSAEQGHADAQLNVGWMYSQGLGIPKSDNKAFEWYKKSAEQGDSQAQLNVGMMYSVGQGVLKNVDKAFEWIKKAAEQGDSDAQNNLGFMYLQVQGNPKNHEKAFEWYKKAAEQGNKKAQYNLGLMYEKGKGVSQDYKKAFFWLEKAAEQGDANAQALLGALNALGLGVSKSDDEAFEWYKKAAKKGDSHAQYELGVMYSQGDIVSKDVGEAFKLFKKSAEQGNPESQFNLGMMYYEGKGVSQDKKNASYWYEKAAQQEHAKSQYNLGWMYTNGEGVLQDYVKSFEWHEKSAKNGYAGAQYELGGMYYEGKGVSQDYDKAFEWSKKSAEQGHKKAQFNLGIMYYEGKGVSQDKNSAFHWLEKSAEQGDTHAQKKLGLMYYEGLGVSQSYEKAFYWNEKAVKQGDSDVQYNLAVMYYNGKGVSQDYDKAFEWSKKSAEQGHKKAQYIFGLMYCNGRGVFRDYEKSAYWLEKAAQQGQENAQFTLGMMYGTGRGVPQNDHKAFEWIKKALDQSYKKGQFNVGLLYGKNFDGLTAGQIDDWEKELDHGKNKLTFDPKYLELCWLHSFSESHVTAQSLLGALYLYGDKLDKYEAQGTRYKTCESSPAGRRWYIDRIMSGRSTTTLGRRRALYYLSKAFEQNDPLARGILLQQAQNFLTSKLSEKDILKLQDSGTTAFIQYYLGYMFDSCKRESCDFCMKDIEKSKEWLRKSEKSQEDYLNSKKSQSDSLKSDFEKTADPKDYSQNQGQENRQNILQPQLNTYLIYLNNLKGIKEFSLGYGHSLFLTEDGKVYSWGWNERGQLGLSDTQDRLTPSLVTSLEDKNITNLSTQDFDKHHSIAMDSEGQLYSWGDNTHGQLGLGDTEVRLSPEEIKFFADKTIIQISLGKSHSLALDSEGQVYSWGWNEGGQLGLGDKKDRYEPTLIPYFKENGIFITQLTTAYKHNLALDKNGKVYSWGWNEYGELGLSHNEERLSPSFISYFEENGIIISKLAISSWQSFALDNMGQLYSWGRNENGRLGLSDEIDRNEPSLIKYFKDNNVIKNFRYILKDISASVDHSIALDDEGNLYSWGRNTDGELGLGDTEHRSTPTFINSLKDKKITEIQTGSYHNIAKTEAGEIYVWGYNKYGQLGLGESKTQEVLREAQDKRNENNFSFHQKSGGYEIANNVLTIYEDPHNKLTHIQGGDFSHDKIEITGETIHLSDISLTAREIYIYLTGKEGQISLANCKIKTSRLVILGKDQNVTIEKSHFDIKENLNMRVSQDNAGDSKGVIDIREGTQIFFNGTPYHIHKGKVKNIHLIKKEDEVLDLSSHKDLKFNNEQEKDEL